MLLSLYMHDINNETIYMKGRPLRDDIRYGTLLGALNARDMSEQVLTWS
jgi:hypothetical protein